MFGPRGTRTRATIGGPLNSVSPLCARPRRLRLPEDDTGIVDERERVMATLIARRVEATRFFPLPGADLYRAASASDAVASDRRVAARLLGLANARFHPWDGWLRRPDPARRVGKVLFQQRMAIDAELAGAWPRAD